jgi:hypothetical protein
VWLQRAGYRTLHFGKFMNVYGGPDELAETEVPPGWDRWVSDATDNSTRQFYGYTQNIDGRIAGPFGSILHLPWEEKDPIGPEPAVRHYRSALRTSVPRPPASTSGMSRTTVFSSASTVSPEASFCLTSPLFGFRW